MPSGAPGAFVSAPLTLGDAALFTDLYELTMAAAFFREGVRGKRHVQPVRAPAAARARLPGGRGPGRTCSSTCAASGSPRTALDYLRSLGRFEPAFLDAPREPCASPGEVRAVREGTVLFAEEPLLEITGPLIEAQLLETAVINFCHVQTRAREQGRARRCWRRTAARWRSSGFGGATAPTPA